MRSSDDGRQPVQQTAGSAEPSDPGMIGLLGVEGGPLAKPAPRPYSYRSECECPDDCLRDHENE